MGEDMFAYVAAVRVRTRFQRSMRCVVVAFWRNVVSRKKAAEYLSLLSEVEDADAEPRS